MSTASVPHTCRLITYINFPLCFWFRVGIWQLQCLLVVPIGPVAAGTVDVIVTDPANHLVSGMTVATLTSGITVVAAIALVPDCAGHIQQA